MKIDITEKQELLPRSPIVEAVIQIHARPQCAWEEKAITENLKPKLKEYTKILSRSDTRHELKLEATKMPQILEKNLGWQGLLFQTPDGFQSVQFNRDGFIFSRLHPYQGWELFFCEAMRLWAIYVELTSPAEAQRIGLRFINKVILPPRAFDFEKYIQPYPEPPFGLDLPFLSFFHHDTLAVPDHPYAINIIRTVQPPQNHQTEGLGLIIDIDAHTTLPVEITMGAVEKRLAELRWLKNKTFFGSVTPEALQLFR